MVRLVLAMALLLPACGGAAICGPFDEGCQRAAALVTEHGRFEARTVHDAACPRDRFAPREPTRCLVFVSADGAQVGTALFDAGQIEFFDPGTDH